MKNYYNHVFVAIFLTLVQGCSEENTKSTINTKNIVQYFNYSGIGKAKQGGYEFPIKLLVKPTYDSLKLICEIKETDFEPIYKLKRPFVKINDLIFGSQIITMSGYRLNMVSSELSTFKFTNKKQLCIFEDAMYSANLFLIDSTIIQSK